MRQFRHLFTSQKKVLGIFALLVVICTLTGVLAPASFLTGENLQNQLRWTALFGVISVGVAFVIMTGGIDLSIGSVIALVGCLFAMAVQASYLPDGETMIHGITHQRQLAAASAPQLNPGDWVRFDGEIHQVQKIDRTNIQLDQLLEKSESTSTSDPSNPDDQDALLVRFKVDRKLVRVYRTEFPDGSSAANPPDLYTGVSKRFGSYFRDLCEIQLHAMPPGIKAGDQIELEGVNRKFPVHQVIPTDSGSRVEFYTPGGQRFGVPRYAVLSQRSQVMPTAMAIVLVLVVSALLGWFHGILITKVPLQPFVVTLCGLLIYRGLSRYITGDQEQGFGSEFPMLKEMTKGGILELFTGQQFAIDIPMPFIYLVLLSIVAAIFLNRTIYGRYILALGQNEDAARYSGINTDRMKIAAYMICSLCAGIAGILFALDINSIQPSVHGAFYELYAIAAAVLGGCSLRGGEGSILGVLIATAVMRVLSNAINLVPGIDTKTEFAIVGFVILAGVTIDELVRRYSDRRAIYRDAKEDAD